MKTSKNIEKYTQKSNYIGYISPLVSQACDTPLEAAQEIYYSMINLLNKNPDIKIIVMPESSYLFPLNTHKDMIKLWYKNILDYDVSLCIGAPYKEGNDLYNALYWIQNGYIQQIYKKTKLMAFAEYVPRFWEKFAYFKKLFLCEPFFTHGQKGRIIFNLCQNMRLKPLICSDFFLGKRREAKQISDKSFSAVIIPVNDHIFPMEYLRNLMFLYAKLESVSRKKDILYVGYYFATWIHKNGFVVKIT